MAAWTDQNLSPSLKPERVRSTPLLYGAVAIIIGIILARWHLAPPLPAVVILIISIVAVVIASLRRFSGRTVARRLAPAAVCIGLACIGALRYCLVYHLYSSDHIVHYCRAEPSLATVHGTVLSEPYIAKPSGALAAYDRLHRPCTIFTLSCESIQTISGAQAVSGLALVTIDQPMLNLRVGQELQLDCKISLRPRSQNPGQFDWTDINRASRKIVACRVNTPEAMTVLADGPVDRGVVLRLRRKLQQLAYPAVVGATHGGVSGAEDPSSQDVRALLGALLLGRRHDMSGRLNELFTNTGTVHFLAVSGLHIGCFTAFIWWLCWLIGLSRLLRGAMTLAALVVFLLIIPSRPPVIRAGIASAVFCIAHMMRRSGRPINILSLAAAVILLWRPIDLFNAGFQLSFVVVLGLLLFAGPWYRAISPSLTSPPAKWITDPTGVRLPARLWFDPADRPAWWRSAAFAAVRWIAGLGIVALIAWFLAMPLVAYHFNRIAPWGVAASVVLFPVVLLALILGFTKLLLAAIVPTIASLIGMPLAGLGGIIIWLTEHFAQLPFSVVYTASPGIWLIVLFYTLLGLTAWSLNRARDLCRYCIAVVLIWLIGFAFLVPFRQDTRDTVLNVLSVGHGTATVIELPDGKVICYDMGSLSNFNAGSSVVLPFLRTRGIQRIDKVFLSHGNIDHYNAMLDVCGVLPVGEVLTTEYFQRDVEADSAYGPLPFLMAKLEQLDMPIHYVSKGWYLADTSHRPEQSAEELYRIEVLWPGPLGEEYTLDSNNSSMVLRISGGFGSMLLCGDIDKTAQRALLDSCPPDTLACDVLIMPHHGALASTLAEFVDAVDAMLIINSSGYLPDGRMAELRRIAAGRRMLHTHRFGAITVRFKPDGPEATSYRP